MKTYGIAILLVIALCGTAMASCCGNMITNSIFPLNPNGCAELPRLPHTFGGCLLVNGEPAPAGTVVCVSGSGVAGTCIPVGPDGCFGLGTFDIKLSATGISVPGGMINVPEGTPLKFSCWIDNIEYSCRVTTGSNTLSYYQFHSGHHTSVVLTTNNVPTGPCPGCGA